MKKTLLLYLIFPLFLSAQNKKTNSIESLKKQTLTWFKNIYVQENWKDPYSFKLVKCSLTPIIFLDHIHSVSKTLRLELATVDTTSKTGVYNKAKYEVKKMKKYYDEDLLGKDSSKAYMSKLSYQDAIMKQIKIKDRYISVLNKISEIDSIRNNSPKEILNKPYAYVVNIDAYGKNSNGVSVLGKYFYTIDQNGNTIKEVNKK